MNDLHRSYRATQLAYALVSDFLVTGGSNSKEILFEKNEEDIKSLKEALQVSKKLACEELNLVVTEPESLDILIKEVGDLWVKLNNNSIGKAIEMSRELCIINMTEGNSYSDIF